jgi:hypothetical protein
MSKRIELADRHTAQLERLLAIHVPEAEVWVFGSCTHGSAHEAVIWISYCVIPTFRRLKWLVGVI